jgi:hypothetical protein
MPWREGIKKLRRCSMKRSMASFVLAAVISSLLIGCVAPKTKVYTEPGQTIEIKVGQRFIIALDENPTTGYTWQEEFDDSFLELVENKGEGFYKICGKL